MPPEVGTRQRASEWEAPGAAEGSVAGNQSRVMRLKYNENVQNNMGGHGNNKTMLGSVALNI